MLCSEDKVDNRRLFSARDTLLGAGELYDRFLQCLLEAGTFLDSTSVSDLMDDLFAHEQNRRAVVDSIHDTFHVGFMVQNEESTLDLLNRAAIEAGFCLDPVTFESTIIARELGMLRNQSSVPTTIFKAGRKADNGRSSYIEVFIPKERKNIAIAWMEEEIGTHIGLTVTNPTAFPKVRQAFQAEGFQMPNFMENTPMTNPSQGISVVYFDKAHRGRSVRIEVCISESC